MAGCVKPGNLPRDCRRPESSAWQPARYCRPSSIDVNDRVITVLFSSQGRSGRGPADRSSGWSGVPVTASTRMFFSRSSNRAACTASEVLPEREITTAARSSESASTRSGKSNNSEAGIARARIPVMRLQAAAAASAT